MIKKRIIAAFLVVMTVFSTCALLVNAQESAPEAEAPVYEFNTGKNNPVSEDFYFTGKYTTTDEEGKKVTDIVDTPQERLELMDLRYQKGDYRLYIDEYSGEIAVEKISTGDLLFSNPYNVGAATNVDKAEKPKYLSQIIIDYSKITMNNAPGNYNSYMDSVRAGVKLDEPANMPSQLKVSYIKSGLRVEYSIGRVDSRYLIPWVIKAEAFESMILKPVTENMAIEKTDKLIQDVKADKKNEGKTEAELQAIIDSKLPDLQKEIKGAIDRFLSFFVRYDLSDPKYADKEDPSKLGERGTALLARYPMLQKTVDGVTVNVPCYVCNAPATPEKKSVEKIIKTYAPDFTYEELDMQHLEVDYTPEAEAEALFKIALEYTLDDNGLSVRVPANGIRFDESLFRLEKIQILPFMGAGINPNKGYTFFPDGSGTLFSFEKLAKAGGNTNVGGTVYGEDFGYYHIESGRAHREPIRYPVFGVSETVVDKETGAENDHGFVAIVEEGEAMMTLISYHNVAYNSVIMETNPRPNDKFMPSGATDPWTVVSERKYTGNYRIRYVLLSDESKVKEHGGYTADYVGMAKAYRDYLINNGTLTALKAEDVKEDIPLYIETFGSIETTKKFLSIPYKTNVAMTSFKNIKDMYDELSENGVKNINFILTGYAKGGLTKDTIPYDLKWDDSVKKDYGFDNLLDDAKGNFGVYPDFDFAFSSNNTLFDGLTLDKHAIKTIDGRYTSKREYSATRQTYRNYYDLAISPAYFSRFYEKLTEQYLKTDPQGISVSTIGSYLSSDFDEDEPYNREDTKGFTVDAFKFFDEKYNKVLTSGGNAFSWKFVDSITDISTDSSRHSRSSATVPFLGIVLHGFVETATTPINMEGNIDYAMLRAIENGAALKFVLSYDNTELLKEYETTSVHYSIRYDIWLEDLIERYAEINRALKDVQTSTIEEHKFIGGLRVPDNNELLNDANEALRKAIETEKLDAATAKESLRVKLQRVRTDLLTYRSIMNGSLDYGFADAKTAFETARAAYANSLNDKSAKEAAVATAQAEYDVAKAEYNVAKTEAEKEGATEEQKNAATAKKTALDEATKALEEATKALEEAPAKIEEALTNLKSAYASFIATVEKTAPILEASAAYEALKADFALLEENDAYTEEIRTELKAILDAMAVEINGSIKAKADAITATAEAFKSDLTANCPEALPEIVEEEEKNDDSVASVYNKYAAKENSIVYERYSNGKAFVLNFNNFAVKVTLNGVSYTVAAYGYIEVK